MAAAPHDTARAPVRAWVLHPDIDTAHDAATPRRAPGHRLAEAMALARALPALEVVGGEVVRIRTPHPGHLFGSGKLRELGAELTEAEIGLVLVDGPVTPVQQRNLEKEWGVKLLDRTGLILEIFADRARTREGVLQVELAALSYQRTRLVRAWTHLERQRGGYGFVGGPGETQIEADRRAIDDQMVRLRRQLEKVTRTRGLHRDARARVPYPIIALVGYTNAGKSTLFNRLTGAEVLVKDMLFATLDPTMRAIRLPGAVSDGGGRQVIVSDTVGFVSDLPHELIAAFRATLEEVLSADLIVHVRDIADPETEAQAGDVRAILASLGVADDVPLIEAWNKIDMLDRSAHDAMMTAAARHPDVAAISALSGEGIGALIAAVEARLAIATGGRTDTEEVTLPPSDGRRRAWLHRTGLVLDERIDADAVHLKVRWSPRQKQMFDALAEAAAGENDGPAPE